MRSNVLFFFALSATVYLVPSVSALPHGNNNLVLRNDAFDSALVERSDSLVTRGNKPSGYAELRGTQYEETPEQKKRREKFEKMERKEQKKQEKKEKKEAKKQGKREFDDLFIRDDILEDLAARDLEFIEARGNKPSGYAELRGTQYEETPEQKKRREKFEKMERKEQKKQENKEKKEAKKQGKREFDELLARDDFSDDLFARDLEFLEARGNKPSGYAELRGTQYEETPEQKKRREKFEKMERKEQKKQEKQEKKEAKKQGKRDFDDLYARDDLFSDLFARDDFSDDLFARDFEFLETRGNKPSGYAELRGTQYEETPEEKKRREKFEKMERKEQKKQEKKEKKEAKKQGKREFDDLYIRDDSFGDLFARDDVYWY
ncbi:hypothetical protein C8Q75DRAFT_894296 [Abortiporus biennis]|nr:hypothetical protein C8Q75DRAFT_894296 [Abortiporus biennis]